MPMNYLSKTRDCLNSGKQQDLKVLLPPWSTSRQISGIFMWTIHVTYALPSTQKINIFTTFHSRP